MSSESPAVDRPLAGERIAFAGRLAGMSKREAQQLVRQRGGAIVERPDATVDLIVLGEQELPRGSDTLEGLLDEPLRQAVARGDIEVITETKLWQRLGFVDSEQSA